MESTLTTILIRLIDALLIMVGAMMFAAGIYLGYWLSRNAQDKPLRSAYNPKKEAMNRDAIGEPGEDPYNQALVPEDPETFLIGEKYETGL